MTLKFSGMKERLRRAVPSANSNISLSPT
jgi:hypothetical protein